MGTPLSYYRVSILESEIKAISLKRDECVCVSVCDVKLWSVFECECV